MMMVVMVPCPVDALFVITNFGSTMDDQGGHKPGLLRDFSEREKLGEFSRNSVQPQGKFVTNKVFLVRHSNICVK